MKEDENKLKKKNLKSKINFRELKSRILRKGKTSCRTAVNDESSSETGDD